MAQKKRTQRPQPLRGQAKAAAALFKQQREDTPHVQEPSAPSSAAQPDAAAATDTVVQPPTVTTDADASQEQRTGLVAVEDSEFQLAVACEHLESLMMNSPTVEVLPACEQEESEDDDDDASPEPADDAGTGFIADVAGVPPEEKIPADDAGTGVIAAVASVPAEKIANDEQIDILDAEADDAGTGVIATVAGVPTEEKISNDKQMVILDAEANDNGKSFASDFVSNLQNPVPKKRQLMRESSNNRMEDLSDIENDDTDDMEIMNDIFGATDDKQESGKVAHTPPT